MQARTRATAEGGDAAGATPADGGEAETSSEGAAENAAGGK